MSTPHIDANPGDIAETVILPGDPNRAKFIAEKYLTNPVCVSEVRSILAFTGTHAGKPLTVMASGMGIPSVSIYATELFTHFGVQQIIRTGSCGSIHDDVGLGDLIVAMGASTDSSVNRHRFMGHDFAAIADYGLMRRWIDAAEVNGASPVVGNVFTTDTFYHSSNDIYELAGKLGIRAVEMETAGLYRIAAEHGRSALAVMTVSDHILRDEHMSPGDRETAFTEMVEITLASL